MRRRSLLALAVAVLPGTALPTHAMAGPSAVGGCDGLDVNPTATPGLFCHRFQVTDPSGAFSGRYSFDQTKAFWTERKTAPASPVYTSTVDAAGLTFKAGKSGAADLQDSSAIGRRLAVPAPFLLVGVVSTFGDSAKGRVGLLNDRAGQIPGAQILTSDAVAVNTGDAAEFASNLFYDESHPDPVADTLPVGVARSGVVGRMTDTAGDKEGHVLNYRLRTTCTQPPATAPTQQVCPVTFQDAVNPEKAILNVTQADLLLQDLTDPVLSLKASMPNSGSCKAPKARASVGFFTTKAPDQTPLPANPWITDKGCVKVSATARDNESGIASVVSSDVKMPSNFPSAAFTKPECEAAVKLVDFGKECPRRVEDEANVSAPSTGIASLSVDARDQGGRLSNGSAINTLHLLWDLKDPTAKFSVRRVSSNNATLPKTSWLGPGDRFEVGTTVSDEMSGVKTLALSVPGLEGTDPKVTQTGCADRTAAAPRCVPPLKSSFVAKLGPDGDDATRNIMRQPGGEKLKVQLSGEDFAGHKVTASQVLDRIDLLQPRITVRNITVYGDVDRQQVVRTPAEVDVDISRLSDDESGLASVKLEVRTRAGETLHTRQLSKSGGSQKVRFTLMVPKSEAGRGGRIRITARDKAGNESIIDRPYDVMKKTGTRPGGKKPFKPITVKPKTPAPTNTNVSFGISLGNTDLLTWRDAGAAYVDETAERRQRGRQFYLERMLPTYGAIAKPTKQVLVRWIAPIDAIASLRPDGTFDRSVGDGRFVGKLQAFADLLTDPEAHAAGYDVRGMISFMGHNFDTCPNVGFDPAPPASEPTPENPTPDPAPVKPLTTCNVPDATLYRRYAERYRAWNETFLGGRIDAWGSWNEPDEPMFRLRALNSDASGASVAQASRQAGAYAAIAQDVFGTADKVVAAEFAGFAPSSATSVGPSTARGRKARVTPGGSPVEDDTTKGATTAITGIEPYLEALGAARPPVWAIHNYADFTPRKGKLVRKRSAEDFASALRDLKLIGAGAKNTEFWVSETGVPLTVGGTEFATNGDAALQYSAGALMRNFGRRIPELRRLITYDVMQGKYGDTGGHDSAWLDRNGQPRYGWCGFQRGDLDGTAQNYSAAVLQKMCGGPPACPGAAVSKPDQPSIKMTQPTETTPSVQLFDPISTTCRKP